MNIACYVSMNGNTNRETTMESNLTGIKTYTVSELRAVAVDDRHSVRDEVLRRHSIATRKLAKLQKQVAELETLAKEVM